MVLGMGRWGHENEGGGRGGHTGGGIPGGGYRRGDARGRTSPFMAKIPDASAMVRCSPRRIQRSATAAEGSDRVAETGGLAVALPILCSPASTSAARM